MVDRQHGISVRPTQCQHTKTVCVEVVRMVVYPREEFYLF